jgi:hypothetical protein
MDDFFLDLLNLLKDKGIIDNQELSELIVCARHAWIHILGAATRGRGTALFHREAALRKGRAAGA